ncbi:hypothetical protein DXT99_01045 [Pontibacter diazotrophicus]|uniref:Uncharacterized protein n=1 Tax=Pontibacter diazotrophicus TaxID=1400979 RepID=A0A3D8LIJ8_9BACT|nr:hypothetical protein DXT99_01045 [Pontibacter diazotrophicus]
MVDRPDIANNAHAATLIGAGLTSYFLNESRPKTALIPPAVGGALLTLSSGVRAGNRTVAHAAVGLTTVLTLMTGRMFAKAVAPSREVKRIFTPEVLNRRATVFGLMTATGIAAVSVYVAGFIQKRKQQQALTDQ